MLGLGEETPEADHRDYIRPRKAHGVKVMSMDFIIREDDPVIWRGPMVDDIIAQLFGDVNWGALDYLVVDLPPGTGDTQLSLVQRVPVTGTVVVTTPQAVAVNDAKRGLQQFVKYEVPVLGIVENMHSFECPNCGTDHDIFGEGGGQSLAEEFDIPVLGEVPLDPDIGDLSKDPVEPTGILMPFLGRLEIPRTRDERTDRRAPVVARNAPEGDDSKSAFRVLATRVAARINERNVAWNEGS
jgi:ATP-binding protein involved in chromosome partitioning